MFLLGYLTLTNNLFLFSRPSRIEPYYHKQLARFLAVRGYATEAAKLEGLSVSTQVFNFFFLSFYFYFNVLCLV